MTMITIKDIARELHVAPSTVSRALQNNPAISKDMREKIQRYAAEHHYKPNAAAAALRASQSVHNRLIGVVLPQFSHYYFSRILTAIEECCSERDYNIIAMQTGDTYEREVRAIQQLRQQGVVGIIISQARDTEQYDHFQAAIDEEIPLVFVDRICTGIRTSRVVVDDYMAAFTATEHLIRGGCRKIAFLGTTMLLEISKNRYNGYRDALRKHHLEIDASIVQQCDNREQAEQLTPTLMALENHPDGFFAINDDTALGVLYTCKRMGYRVPEDVCICGFADGIRARSCDPQLTTVEQRGEQIGKEATEVLFDSIDGNIAPGKFVNRIVKTKLVVRGTTR